MTTIDLFQNILWTTLVLGLPFGFLLAILFTATRVKHNTDLWMIPTVLSTLIVSVSMVVFVFLGVYLILYAIWN